MRLSERTIKALQKVINGDEDFEHAIYRRSGSMLVDFFNNFGSNDVYGPGFPSRWDYTRRCIRSFNGTNTIKEIIESSVNPSDDEMYQLISPKLSLEKIEKTVSYLNEFLASDGYTLKLEKGETTYRVFRSDEHIIATEQLTTLSTEKLTTLSTEKLTTLPHEFINDQIRKINEKLDKRDYDGAITNARSLVEAVQEEIIRKAGAKVPKWDGNLMKLYKATKQTLNLDPSQKDLSDTLKQILTGLNSLVSGVSGLSNQMADRHFRPYKPSRHHAKLAVNAAFTFCEFLLESHEYQQKQELQEK